MRSQVPHRVFVCRGNRPPGHSNRILQPPKCSRVDSALHRPRACRVNLQTRGRPEAVIYGACVLKSRCAADPPFLQQSLLMCGWRMAAFARSTCLRGLDLPFLFESTAASVGSASMALATAAGLQWTGGHSDANNLSQAIPI